MECRWKVSVVHFKFQESTYSTGVIGVSRLVHLHPHRAKAYFSAVPQGL